MFRLRESISKTVVFSLISVTTLALALFGAMDYYRERAQILAELNASLKESTAQLSASLSNSLWNMDMAHVGKILESSMLNHRIYGVLVREADSQAIISGRVRDGDWKIAQTDSAIEESELFSEKRDIFFDNRIIGSVQVFATTRFMKAALRNSLFNIVARIFVLNILLVTIIAMLLRRNVFIPLQTVEGYALKVSQGEGDVAPLQEMRFRGEIENLRSAIETMVGQLQAAEKKYRDIFENASEGVFQTSADGKFISANPSLARMLGYDSPADLMRRVSMIADQVYFDSREREVLLDALRCDGAVTGFKARFIRRDNQTIWVLINARAVKRDDGGVLYIEGATVDITARERAERRLEILNRHLKRAVQDRTKRLAEKAAELEEANERLTELDELKSSFLSTVSHDLRTPLTSVLGFAKLINRDFSKSFMPFSEGNEALEKRGRRIVENLTIIESEGERLTRLINDFLDLSKIESGKAEWRDRDVDVSVIIDQAAKAVSGDFAGKPSVSFGKTVAANLPTLHVDPDRLTQVLVNLLGNAIKFTEFGRVEVRALVQADERLHLEVSDTGAGIPADSLENIFDKFQQAGTGDTTSDKPKGTGLGLAICKHIVEHYRGTIRAESVLGKGSLFLIDLPVPRPS